MCKAGGTSRISVKCCEWHRRGLLSWTVQGLLGSCPTGDWDLLAQHSQLPEMDLILDLSAEIQSMLSCLPQVLSLTSTQKFQNGDLLIPCFLLCFISDYVPDTVLQIIVLRGKGPFQVINYWCFFLLSLWWKKGGLWMLMCGKLERIFVWYLCESVIFM